jgi:hypothetical protein
MPAPPSGRQRTSTRGLASRTSSQHDPHRSNPLRDRSRSRNSIRSIYASSSSSLERMLCSKYGRSVPTHKKPTHPSSSPTSASAAQCGRLGPLRFLASYGALKTTRNAK